MTKWNCIEDRVDNGTKYGRTIRKVIQGDIFADKTAVFSSNPIPANALRHLNVSFVLKIKTDFIMNLINYRVRVKKSSGQGSCFSGLQPRETCGTVI